MSQTFMYICLMKEVVVINEDTVTVSQQDLDIVNKLSNGLTCGEIGFSYNLSKRTIEAHVSKLKNYFDCDTIPQLVATFIRKGLIK